MPMNYPRFNRLAYTPSGAKSKYGELSEKLKSGVSGGGFSPSTFLQGFSGNPYEGVIEVAETIALAVAQSIPEAGFLLSGILSVAFTALNKSMQQDDGFSKIVKLISDAEIDRDNINQLVQKFEGLVDTLSEHNSTMTALGASAFKPENRSSVVASFEAVEKGFIRVLPEFLLQASGNANQTPGLPVYAFVASAYIQFYMDFLATTQALELSSELIKQHHTTLENNIYHFHEKIYERFKLGLDEVKGKGDGWTNGSRFINGVYTGGLAVFCLIARRKWASTLGGRFEQRNSIEIYGDHIYYNSQSSPQSRGFDSQLDKAVKKLPLRVSPATFFDVTGFKYNEINTHLDMHGREVQVSIPHGGVIRIEQGFADGDLKESRDLEEACVGNLPGAVAANFRVSTFAKQDEKYQKDAASIPTGLALEELHSHLYSLSIGSSGPVGLPSLPVGVRKDGYILSSFVTEGASSPTACNMDDSLLPIAVAFRHWSSIEHLALIDDAAVGLELDSTCGLVVESLGKTTAYPDPLIGKNRLDVPANQNLTFKVINQTQKSVSYHLVAYLKKSDAHQDVAISVNEKKSSRVGTAEAQGKLRSIDGSFYSDVLYDDVELHAGENILTIGSGASFGLATIILIPK